MSTMTLEQKFRKKRRKTGFLLLGLAVILVVLACLMMTVGNTVYTLGQVIEALQSKASSGPAYTMRKLRLPRTVIGILAGAGFGVAGYTFQTMLRNPLASPDIIGITAGSSTAAVFCILIAGISGPLVSVFSAVAGMVVTFLIFLLSGGFSRKAGNRMILIGIGSQAILNALVSWMLLVGSEYDVGTALRWLRGSLNGAQLSDIAPMVVIVLPCLVILLCIRRSLMMMELGEEYPLTLGVHVRKTTLTAMLCALLLCAAASAVTGPIASVAFLAGPIAGKVMGKSEDTMIASGIVGAILVLASELVGQNLLPARYPVGVITGLLGAPYLLLLLLRLNKKGA